MAKKVIVELVDDYDSKSEANETVHFAIDGIEYEIDLSTKNANKLRGIFEQWTSPARKIGRNSKHTKTTGGPQAQSDRQQTAAIRDWARNNGHEVSRRGRIHKDIIAAYNNAS
ncbi:Nucleoid-associated protein Lsr2 [Nocardia cerradoensis]|uniref:Nucleoid-associated protein Lsr2 n=1 Tax=Nocardia cerradoensis TaxID=85688 RepID=A0A231GX30_9NOCA|nr:Lsr2 family protein [Nocardia cerradoensis]OXR41125.1 Nucleoid-associated protein Lsr2 [Nocardia cerradoensis]